MGRPAFASTGGGTSPGISRSGGDEYTPPGASKRSLGVIAGLGGLVVALGITLVVVGRSKTVSVAAGSAQPPGETSAVASPPKPAAPPAASLEALPSLAPPPATSATPSVPTAHAERVTGAPGPAHAGAKQATAPTPTAAPAATHAHPAAAGAATVDLGY
jgi:hypothetical protein